MTTDTATPVQQLAAIREQWGDLLAAIERPPAAEWPPRETRGWLDNGAADAERTDRPAVGRLPLTLRQHPAPLNLDALDAAVSIETALFDLADRIAAAVQTITAPDGPDRWHYAGLRHLDRRSPISTAGSRALGLHWCAKWIEQRLTYDGPEDVHGSPRVVRGVLRDHAAEVIDRAHRDVQRALGRDGRATPLPDPCPWCHGELTARTTSGDPYAAVVTCGTGPTCTAPVPYDDQARRAWHGHLLGGLYSAMQAARTKETAA